MYLKNTNATASAAFPQSCCVADTVKNVTCPETIGEAKTTDPIIFKKKVRKCRKQSWLDVGFNQYYVDAGF